MSGDVKTPEQMIIQDISEEQSPDVNNNEIHVTETLIHTGLPLELEIWINEVVKQHNQENMQKFQKKIPNKQVIVKNVRDLEDGFIISLLVMVSFDKDINPS